MLAFFAVASAYPVVESCLSLDLGIVQGAMSQLTVLLDWSNYVFAQMEPVIESFLSSESAETARQMLAEFREQQHDLDTVRKFQYKLRQLLRKDAREFRRRVAEDVAHPERLLVDARIDPEAHIYEQLQQPSIHLVVVTEQGKKGRWKSPQLVVHKAKQLAEQYGVSLSEFEGIEPAQEAADQAADLHVPESAPDAQQDEQQLTQELEYRIKGALIFMARDELDKALVAASNKPLQISGTTADEAIAAVAQANAASLHPLPLCIKSDDTDFWQLKHCNIFQIGIKYELQIAATDMQHHYLQKEALLGKGRDDLNTFGTVFGPVPHGVECIDAAGTAVVGQYRPGDQVYAEQFAAFDAAVKQEEPWHFDITKLLEWLQQFQHQVPSIRARFIVKMVDHNIDPYSHWSAMPQDLQETCKETAKEVIVAAAVAAAVKSKVPTFAAMQLNDLADWLPAGSLAGAGRASKAGSSSSSSSKKKGKKKGRR